MTAPPHKELGETKDKTELVPGNVEHIDANVTALKNESKRITTGLDAVKKVRTEGWVGGTAATWEDAQDREVEKWKAYKKLLDLGATALDTYAEALGSAQTKAQEAILKWEEGEKATETARTEYNAAVTAYNNSICAPIPFTSPLQQPPHVVRPAHPGEFVDPGQALRDRAEEILADAREKVAEAGDKALVELGNLDGAKKEGDVDVLGAEGNLEGPTFSWDAWEDTFGNGAGDGVSDKDKLPDSPFKISLGSADGSAWVFKADGSVEDYWGDVKVHTDGSVTALGADGKAELLIDKNGLAGTLSGTLTVIGAEGEAGFAYGIVDGKVKAEASIEASAEGTVNVGKHGAHVSGEAFAGGKVSGTVEGDVGGVGGSGTAEGWAGIGAAYEGELGLKDGKLTIGGSGGLAVGLGGKVKLEVTLDFPEIAETSGEAVDTIIFWDD